MTQVARTTVTGHYAGPVSRAIAAALDAGIIVATYTAAVAGLRLLLDTFFSVGPSDSQNGLLAAVALGTWSFFYVFASLAVTGKTVGKGIVGVRVVLADGSPLSVRAAFVRTLIFPLSGLFFGLGYLLILVQREHRAAHDLIAGTCVVYDWGAREAQLPGPLTQFLARRQVGPQG